MKKLKRFSHIFTVYLVLFEFTVYMANDLIMPGMLKVVQEFHAKEDYVPLSLSLFILGGMVLQFIVGPVSDRIGRRPSMLAGCAFFLFCTLMIIFSQSIDWFMAARFFQGMGLCFIGVCGYATVQELFEEKEAVRVIAWMTSTSVLAPVLGPIVGGFFTQMMNWRWIFAFTVVCTVVSGLGLWLYMPETVNFESLNLSTSGKPSSKRKAIKKELVSTLAQYREVLTHRKLAMGGCLGGLFSIPVICWIAISPIVLFKNAGVSPNVYGLIQIPIFGFYILGTAVLRKMTRTLSLTQIIKLSLPICVAGLVGLCLATLAFPTSYWSLVAPLSLYSLGYGIISAPLTRLSLYSSHASKGIASAVYSTIGNVILISAISAMPLIFRSENSEFGYLCLACGFLILGGVLKFLRYPVSLKENKVTPDQEFPLGIS